MTKNTDAELTRDTLLDACHTYGLDSFTRSEQTVDGLYVYLSLLMKWNRVMNLVGKTQWQEALRTLLADSIPLFTFITGLQRQGLVPAQPRTWDLGAGAGLPGIPLRLLWQDGHYRLVEAREKRSLFLRSVLAAHDFGETAVAQARAEQFMPAQPPANLVISRAFMPWDEVLDFIEPYLTPAGVAVFLTLTSAPEQHTSGISGRVWRLAQETRYVINRDERYLWALQLQN